MVNTILTSGICVMNLKLVLVRVSMSPVPAGISLMYGKYSLVLLVTVLHDGMLLLRWRTHSHEPSITSDVLM